MTSFRLSSSASLADILQNFLDFIRRGIGGKRDNAQCRAALLASRSVSVLGGTAPATNNLLCLVLRSSGTFQNGAPHAKTEFLDDLYTLDSFPSHDSFNGSSFIISPTVNLSSGSPFRFSCLVCLLYCVNLSLEEVPIRWENACLEKNP